MKLKRWNTLESYFNKNTLNLGFLFVFSVFINYYSPSLVRQVVFLSYLIFFYRSRNDSFWIAFFWILVWAPAYLFNSNDPIYNLNFVPVPGFGVEFYYFELIMIVALVKALIKKNNIRIFIPVVIVIILVYCVFLFIISFWWSIEPVKIFRTIRFLIPFTILFSIPKLLSSEEKFLKTFNIFIFFTLIIFALQIFVFLTGHHLFYYFGGTIPSDTDFTGITFNANYDLVRPVYSTHILIVNIIIGIYYLLKKEKDHLKIPRYTIAFIFLSWLGLIISATRGYAVAATVMILMFLLLNISSITKNIKYVFNIIILASAILLIPSVTTQITFAFQRLSTISSVIEGDVTASGTLRRLSLYIPLIEQKIPDSPVFGFGYSNIFYKYTNAHIGLHNILLNGGIVGLILFFIMIFYFGTMPIKIYKTKKRYSYLAITIGIIGFFIVHVTSFSVFSFLVGQNNYHFFFLFLGFIIVLIRNNLNERMNFRKLFLKKTYV